MGQIQLFDSPAPPAPAVGIHEEKSPTPPAHDELQQRMQALDDRVGPWVFGAPVRGQDWDEVRRYVYLGCTETWGEAKALRTAYHEAVALRRRMAWAAHAAGKRAYDTEPDERLAVLQEPFCAQGPLTIFRVGRGGLADAERPTTCHFCTAPCTVRVYADGYTVTNPHRWLRRGEFVDELCPYADMEYPRSKMTLQFFQ